MVTAANVSTKGAMLLSGSWKMFAALSLGSSSLAHITQVSRNIDLIDDPKRRETLEFLYLIFEGVTSVVGIADIFISNPVIFEFITRRYIQSAISSALPAEMASRTVNELAAAGTKISDKTFQLGKKVMNAGWNLKKPKALVNNLAKAFSEHGATVRGDFIQLANGAKISANPKTYTDILYEITEEVLENVGPKIQFLSGYASHSPITVVSLVKALSDELAWEIATRYSIRFHKEIDERVNDVTKTEKERAQEFQKMFQWFKMKKQERNEQRKKDNKISLPEIPISLQRKNK